MFGLITSWVRPRRVRAVRWQIKGCQTTEPRTFDSGFSGKVNLSTLSFMVHLHTYLLPSVYPITYFRVSPLCTTKLDILRIPLLETSGNFPFGTVPKLAICHYWYWVWLICTISGTGRPISGTGRPILDSMRVVIFRVPYWNWHLCVWSHFRYRALLVSVRSFLGSRTRTGIYVRGPISGTGLCQFRYGHF